MARLLPYVQLFISASQITLFQECQRKYAFKYVEKIPTPIHPGAALGTETHEQLAAYMIEGRDFDLTKKSGLIAQTLKPLLPAPKTPGLVAERKFIFPSPSGKFEYLGFIDLYGPDSTEVPGLSLGLLAQSDGPAPLLGDYKTTKNFKHAKTSAILRTDVQSNLYAKALMVLERVEEVDAVWFTARTTTPYRAQRAHLRMVKSSVDEQFERIDAIGAEAAAIRLASPKALDLPPNPLMCREYGGCPFNKFCNLAPPVFAAMINDEECKEMETAKPDPAFLNRFRKKDTALPPSAPVPVVVPVAIPTQSSAPALDVLPSWAIAPVDPMFPKAAINPPESALPPAPPVGAAAPAEEPTPKKRGRPAKEPAPTPAPSQQLPLPFPVKEVALALRALADALEAR